jgi:hypothetical protein
MITLKTIGLSLTVASLGLVSLPTQGLASSFRYGQEESELFATDFDTSSGWLLGGTVINSGTIRSNSPWGKASYSLNPVSLDEGNIFLYWSGIFPIGARTEPEKYYVGLQYSDNAPVCYNSQTNRIVGNPPCTGTSVSEVDENAELKVEMRPRDKTNSANTYHKLYVDPDFDPISNYSPASTRTNVPAYKENVPVDFRLGIGKKKLTEYEISFSYWDGISWLLMTSKQGYNLPLIVGASDWINANRQIDSPVTFEAINLQFRQATATRQSAITAIALTQIRSQPIPLRQQAIQVPEASATITLPLLSILGLGMLFLRESEAK